MYFANLSRTPAVKLRRPSRATDKIQHNDRLQQNSQRRAHFMQNNVQEDDHATRDHTITMTHESSGQVTSRVWRCSALRSEVSCRIRMSLVSLDQSRKRRIRRRLTPSPRTAHYSGYSLPPLAAGCLQDVRSTGGRDCRCVALSSRGSICLPVRVAPCRQTNRATHDHGH